MPRSFHVVTVPNGVAFASKLAVPVTAVLVVAGLSWWWMHTRGADDAANISEIVATRTQTTRIMSLLLGAVAGISLLVGVIGILGALLAGKLGSLPVQLDWQVVALAAGCSVATGLFFGFYPARKASQLDPIEALHHQG